MLFESLLITSKAAKVKGAFCARIFRLALKRAGCSPEEAVVVGDSWASDIVGARNAGIRAVWFNPGGLPKPEAPEARELRSLLPVERAMEKILAQG